MSIVQDQPEPQQPANAETQPGTGVPPSGGYPGDGGSGGYPGGPWGYGGGGYGGGGYGGGEYGGGGYPPQPPAPGSRRPRRRVVVGVVAAAAAFAAGAGLTAWAAGVPGVSTTGASRVLSTASIVQKTDPAVVDIVSMLGDQGEESAGTGIVLTSSGLVLTNNHVIDGATSIKVTEVASGQTYTATVVGYDATHDIAVLKLQGASGLKTASLGNSSTVATSQKVVAVGNAGGKGGLPSVATGTVIGLNQSITATDAGSGTSERLTGMIKTNADIQAGDSGGPLLNTAGQVIGIDTAAATGYSQATQYSTQSVQAFSIPITRALSTANEIEAGDASTTVHIGATAFLGVAVSSEQGSPGEGFGQGSGSGSSGSTATGATIEGVVQGDAAAKAGLAEGDVIVSVGGHSVTSPNDLRDILVGYHPGDSVSITWQTQSGQSHSARVVLGSGPAA
jgi:S1-C subfamily serine protease